MTSCPLPHPRNSGTQSFVPSASKTACLPLLARRFQPGFSVLKPRLMLQRTRDPYISCEYSACVLATFVHNWSAFMRKLQSQSQTENVTPPCPRFLKAPLAWRCSCCWKRNKRTPFWCQQRSSEGWCSGLTVSGPSLPGWEIFPEEELGAWLGVEMISGGKKPELTVF